MDVASESQPLIKRLPTEERYGLADQWRRASYSVPLNIAEGAGRKGLNDFRRYLNIARGSLQEIGAILELVARLGYFTNEELTGVKAKHDECSRTVWGLLRSLGRPPR
jgi:four helix bundle protein